MSNAWLGLVVLSLPLLAGCGQSSAAQALPGSVVMGVIQLDGKPAVAARLRFIPIETTRGYGGHAFTDASGQYMVEGSAGTNQLPDGTYKVVVETFSPPEDPELAKQFPAPAGKPTRIPAIYGDEGRTPLVAVVATDGAPINLELKSR